MMVLSVLFVGSAQPVFMVMMLVGVTLLYSVYVYKVMGSYWFSYALVMVFLSGVLVVFTYMVSLMPNESFEMYDLVVFVMFVFMLVGWVYDVYGVDMGVISLSLWSSYLGMVNLFLVVFLLGVMMMVVWLSYKDSGAVRVM